MTSEDLFSGLMAHWIHQDKLFWGRVYTLFAVQGVVFTFSYQLRETPCAPFILLFGAIFSYLLFNIAKIDEVDRDLNRDIIELTGEELIPDNIKKELIKKREKNKIKGPLIRLTSEHFTKPKKRGGYLLQVIFITFILVDIILALLYLVIFHQIYLG